MANTYTWSVVGMTSYPTYESQTDVVFNVSWLCNGTNGATPVAVTASVPGNTQVTYTAGTPFTPYSQLTESMVMDWVQAALGADGMAVVEAQVDKQISNQITPPTANLSLPWATA